MANYDTEVVRLDPEHPDPAVMERAGEMLRAGELVAFPTETVYGLGANALDAESVARIFEAKGRPATDPLIVHLADLAGVEALVAGSLPQAAYTLGEAFWPGPLTLVLPRGSAVPLNVTAGLDTVAVRMPAHPVARALILAAGTPIAAPSANLFTHTSPTRAADVVADLGGRVRLILDAGPTIHGVESTVVDLCSDPPRVLRPGAVTLEALRAVLPGLAAPPPPGVSLPGEQRSPGTMLKHYAPRAEVVLLDGDDPARVRAGLAEAVTAARAEGRKVGLLLADDDLAALDMLPPGRDLVRMSLGAEGDLEGQARRLFAALRDLDAAGVSVIVVRAPATEGLGLTIRDRLVRAAR
ncbi:MAG: L-threonylcarbamoyladenylate synthase [Chloroflexia bacterium]